MSSPRDAISAISSAVGVFLDILGIALFFLAGRIPGRDEVVVFTLPVLPDHGWAPVADVSLAAISYLKLSGSRLSIRPSAVSACGYMRKPTAAPADPGSATSCAKLYATQFISQDPNSRARACFTISSSSGRFPGGSSSTTFRMRAWSTVPQQEAD